MNIQQAIAQVVDGQSLSRADMEQVMLAVMQGEATEAQIGGLLVGLRIKGETIDEIVALLHTLELDSHHRQRLV